MTATHTAATADEASHAWLTEQRLRAVGVAALVVASLLAVAAGLWPVPVALAAVAAAVVSAVAARPQLAAYAYLAITPLVVGVARGSVLPFVRPQELLLGLLWLGVLAGPVRRWAVSGRRALPALQPLDVAVAALALTSSVTPLLWMYARGAAISLDDVLFALTLWKYLSLYLLVRITLRGEQQIRRALAVVLCSTAVVAVIGVLQSLELLGVPALLTAYAPDDEQQSLSINRASSTIGTPIGFADVMVLGLAVAAGWFVLVRTRRWLVAGAAGLFALAGLASGQASGVLGLAVGALVVGWLLRRLGVVLLTLVPLAAAAAFVLQPVITERLERVDPVTGLPISWTGEYGRLANLRTHIWPRIGEDLNWLFGVRPSSRVAAPEPWRDWVWIESGHTWLVWNGGVPLLLAFVAYLVLALRTTRRALRVGGPGAATAAVAGFTGACLLGVLMVLDPHLTIRGSADLLFPLLAMSASTCALAVHRKEGLP